MSIITTHKELTKALSNERLKTFKIYDENLGAAEHRLESVLLNKPRYVGAAILAISKTIMYEFHYSYMMEKYPDAKLLFTDTDSFCYHIPNVTKDEFYDHIKKDGENEETNYFDRSNYTRESGMYCEKNEMIPGKFKDECPLIPIQEFVGLRSKMYSMKLGDNCSKATAKGVGKIAREQITHEQYYESLFNSKDFTHEDVRIAQKNHELTTRKFTKKSLCPFNDKRHIERNGDEFIVHSIGHKNLQNSK